MKPTKTVIWPIFHALHREGGKEPVLDHDGEESCAAALLVARRDFPDGNCIIVPTAGRSRDIQWKGIVMSRLMVKRLLAIGCDERMVSHREASKFNTLGEAKELVRFIEENEDIQEVVICGKYWHALRCWMALDFCLDHSDKITGRGRWDRIWRFIRKIRHPFIDIVEKEKFERPVKIRVEACSSTHAADSSIRNEFNFAIPKNILRFMFARAQYWLGFW